MRDLARHPARTCWAWFQYIRGMIDDEELCRRVPSVRQVLGDPPWPPFP